MSYCISEIMLNYSAKHKGVFERIFPKKDLGEAADILNIKRDQDA